jgi:hypothetical protein
VIFEAGPLFAQDSSTAHIFIRTMDDSLKRLQAKIARQIAEREASIQPLRDYAMRTAAPQSDVALVALEQELAAWKRMAMRLATLTVYEPRDHRALRLPPQR